MKEQSSVKKDSLCTLSTGLKELDRLCSGLQKSNLYLIAARPFMGKTAFALNIARHVALLKKRPVIYFTPVLSEKKLLQLMLSAESDIELEKISSGQLNINQSDRLKEITRQIGAAPFYIYSKSQLTVETIRKEILHNQDQYTPEVIFIDYLQLISGQYNYSSRKKMNEEIIIELKNIAGEFNLTVLLLSQLTRHLEERTNRRPVLNDLLVYGDIVKSADLVIFIYRDKYYDKVKTGNDIAEINVAKNRYGYTDSFKLLHLEQYKKFVEFA